MADKGSSRRPAGQDLEASSPARISNVVLVGPGGSGKTTLVETLLAAAGAVSRAGTVRDGSTVCDFEESEHVHERSLSLAVAPLVHDGTKINLVDTPGHSDFSEDTYRVLSAVDAAVMLVDAAKGLEPQTLKLFRVCKARGIPVITVINKWDRPGQEPLELLDEIESRLGIVPTPLNWPVGIAGDFRGLVDPSTGGMTQFTRTPGGATIAGVSVATFFVVLVAVELRRWQQARRAHSLGATAA